jgi:hypothetical protein
MIFHFVVAKQFSDREIIWLALFASAEMREKSLDCIMERQNSKLKFGVFPVRSSKSKLCILALHNCAFSCASCTKRTIESIRLEFEGLSSSYHLPHIEHRFPPRFSKGAEHISNAVRFLQTSVFINKYNILE